MVLDYKGVSFSFQDRKRAKRAKLLRLIILALIVFFSFLFIANLLDSRKLSSVQKMLLAGKTTEAAERFQEIKPSFFHNDTRKELEGLVLLCAEDFSGAETVLKELGDASTSIMTDKFLNYFSGRADYRQLRIYSQFLIKRAGDSPEANELLFFSLMAGTGLMDAAEGGIKKISPDTKKKHSKELERINLISKQVTAGKVNYIFDVNGKPLAYYDMATNKTISVTPGIHFDEFNLDLAQSLKFYHLTLDRQIQVLLQQAFRNFHGSFVLFNVTDSSIAAAYSKPLDNAGENGNSVFTESYEPGSIVKLMTMIAYLNSRSVSKTGELFPFRCQGRRQTNGEIFYDWITHKIVDNIDEALAVSCNLAFARMGSELGVAALHKSFKQFFFDSEGIADLFLTFKTGKVKGTITTEYQLSNMSVGLDEITMTTFHAGLLSNIITQDGSVYAPYMIKNKNNLLDISFYRHEAKLLPVLKDSGTFLKVKNAMLYVVESPDGTGRRSRLDEVQVAMKTGTAGSKRKGLDAVITGFFPASRPQYAFAFRLQHVGKAEWKGALFLKNFLNVFVKTHPIAGATSK